MTRQADIFGSSVVAIGAFNPAIFSPDWLERNNLIGKDDLDEARKCASLIVSQQVTSYETDWFSLQVVEDQFTAQSKGALTPAFSDLVSGILSLVPHTPVTAIGVNFFGHYKMSDADQYHHVGDVLAPKAIWKELFPGDSINAGMADLTMLIQKTDENRIAVSKDQKRISVQPSSKLRCGLFFSYNDHHEVKATDGAATQAEVAVNIISANWEPVWHDAVRVFDGILSRALAA